MIPMATDVVEVSCDQFRIQKEAMLGISMPYIKEIAITTTTSCNQLFIYTTVVTLKWDVFQGQASKRYILHLQDTKGGDARHIHAFCDAEVGCISRTSIQTIYSTFTGTTEPVRLPNEKVTAETPTVMRNGTSNAEWKIYTLCITVCFIVTGFGHLCRKYRKQRSLKVRNINEEVDSEPLESTLFETINFVCHEGRSYTKGNKYDEAGYPDLYFAMKEDDTDKVKDRASQRESLSTGSSNSNVVGQDLDIQNIPSGILPRKLTRGCSNSYGASVYRKFFKDGEAAT
ncbi:unnamed protein product [Mytilus coruscus]|uniref:Uncharacterized protein n=1 Tax=Mytilus coruscus TaxID=42192 RepID=A0A6J8BJ78_MYTCO|nr:unnamed protein product [Mytilus coruscus]